MNEWLYLVVHVFICTVVVINLVALTTKCLFDGSKDPLKLFRWLLAIDTSALILLMFMVSIYK